MLAIAGCLEGLGKRLDEDDGGRRRRREEACRDPSEGVQVPKSPSQ